MAKRRGGIDPMEFVDQQEGDGGLKDLTTLMGLLGLGPGGKEEERLSKAQQAQQAYYEGMVGEQKAQTAAQKSAAETAAAERKAAEEFRTGTITRDIQSKMDEAAERARAAKAKEDVDIKTSKINALDRMIERGVIRPEQGQAMLERIDPEYAEMAKGLKEEAYAAQLEKYKGLTPKQRAAIAKAPAEIGGPEIYKRILAETKGAPEMPSPQGGGGADGGLASILWNVPGSLQNVGKGIANLLLRAGGGAGAPQVPYTEYTDPNAEIPRYREAQAVLDRSTPVGPPPEGLSMPVLGNYGPSLPPATIPEWQYGVGRIR